LDGVILLKAGDKITTDHIMPAGAYLKYRSNIPVYARYVFECFNDAGKPTFAERAAAVRDSGRIGVIVAGESYGQGSSREHAAICPMYLGVRLLLARSFERIHTANLVNFGILPLLFRDADTLEMLSEGAAVRVKNLRDQLRSGGEIHATVVQNGQSEDIVLVNRLSAGDVEMVHRGGVLCGD
jgi:aconitate hydratase